MLETVGDIFLCVAIIGGIVIFTCANVNYMPENNDEGDNK